MNANIHCLYRYIMYNIVYIMKCSKGLDENCVWVMAFNNETFVFVIRLSKISYIKICIWIYLPTYRLSAFKHKKLFVVVSDKFFIAVHPYFRCRVHKQSNFFCFLGSQICLRHTFSLENTHTPCWVSMFYGDIMISIL